MASSVIVSPESPELPTGDLADGEAHLILDLDEAHLRPFHQHQRTGRPLGDTSFLLQLEEQLGRFLRKRKRGPEGPRKGSERDN